MRYNIKLHLAYDGSSYLGWQKTPTGPSIEAELEKALTTILQEPIELQAASRTDAGVHAEDQVVNFYTSKDPSRYPQWLISLNQLLPKDIRVYSLDVVDSSFHPTLDSLAKEYHYHLCTAPCLSPFDRHYIWHLPKELDLELMKKGATFLIGKQDFAAFTNTRKPSYENTIREIFSIEISQDGAHLCFRIQGNHFLYKMVRNIVGTLCYVGSGKLSSEEIPLILASKKRILAGMTAPACGLVLKKIYYPSTQSPTHFNPATLYTYS